MAGPLVERKKDGKSGKSKTKKQRGAYERKNAMVGVFGEVKVRQISPQQGYLPSMGRNATPARTENLSSRLRHA